MIIFKICVHLAGLCHKLFCAWMFRFQVIIFEQMSNSREWANSYILVAEIVL